jgi:twitching motility protein PilT
MRNGGFEMTTTAKLKLERLLDEAARLGSSDAFLVPGEPLTIRIDGQIQRTDGDILSTGDIDEMAAVAFGEDRLEAFRKDFILPQCLWSPAGEQVYDRQPKPVRMNMIRSCGRNAISVHLNLPEIGDVQALRVPEAILNAALSPSGLIICSGRYGWNPETTAYSLVEYINANRACHIRTAENPIYARFTSKKALLQQCQIGSDAPSTEWVVRASMFPPADVFFVSELTNLETGEACLTAGETGRLAITVMHLPDRPQWVIDRLVEAFPVDQQMAILKVLSKHLRAICCPRPLPGANGGEVTAYAVLVPDAKMRQAMSEGKDFMARETPMPPECQTMEQAIQRSLDAGEITRNVAQQTLAEIS